MPDIFLERSILGELSYESVYEYYDEPRFFSASNEVGNYYLCYWLGTEGNNDKWLVFNVSPERLRAIEQRERCIRDSLLYQEGTVSYIFFVPLDAISPSDFRIIDSDQVEQYITLPKRGLYVTHAPGQVVRTLEEEDVQGTSHEIHIEKASKNARPLSMEQIMIQLRAFSDLYNSFANQRDVKSRLLPSHSRAGSFILSLDVEKINDIQADLVGLFNLISQGEDVKPYVLEKGIDATFLLNFFYSVSDSNAIFDLKLNETGESVLKLSAKDVHKYIDDLEFIHIADSSIRSSQVPQANDLDKLFEVIEKKAAGIFLSTTELNLTDRQIQYYLHAASTLSFVDVNWTITALGRKVAQADRETRLKLTAESFVLSDCAMAWTSWANVQSTSDLEPNSAAQFLIECCSSLSESTARRRASTLVKWFGELYEFFPGHS